METLAERIARDGPVSELDAIGWAIRLAKRLEALHQLGVAHGSVSPACVIAAGQDRNARAYLADVQHTTPSPAYHSPERILGGNISAADDAWALAATLYALLTGQGPYAGPADAEIRQKILAASPAPLAVYDVGDDDLQHILDRAFSRELAQRTASVAALRRSLEEWHPDRGVANLPPLEDEDSTNDDDDGARTMLVREAGAYLAQAGITPGVAPQPAPPAAVPMGPMAAPSPGPAMRAPFPAPAVAMGPQAAPVNHAPAAAALAKVGPGDDDDDDDDVRTVMREMPKEGLAAILARAQAAAPGAAAPPPAAPLGMGPGPAQPPGPARPAPFPQPGPPRPGPAAVPQPPAPAAHQEIPKLGDEDDDDGEDVRTVMRTPEQMLQDDPGHKPPAPTLLLADEPAWKPGPAAGQPAPARAQRADPAPAPTVALPVHFEPPTPSFGGDPFIPGAQGTQKIPPLAVLTASAAAQPGPQAQPASASGAFPAPAGALQPIGPAGPVLGAAPPPVAAPLAAEPPAGSKKGLIVAALLALLIAAGATFAFLKLKGL